MTSTVPTRTQVVIVGGGPAGLMLARLLGRAGLDSVILERHTREHVLARIRAGVLEWGSVELLRAVGLGERMDAEGFVHDGVGLSFAGRHLRIDFRAEAGRSVMVYGQTEVTKDLYAALDDADQPIVHEAADVAIHDVTTDAPYVTFAHDGAVHRIDCTYVAGCDGFHGVSRTVFPPGHQREYERVYPFGWLGILSETPPVDDELIYAHHERGFALCSMRHSMLSRYYVQCPLEDSVEDWSDDRFWDELSARLPADAAARLVTGPSIEKSIAPLRSYVAEPLSYGRLFIAGDAAHIVPPTGAKGLNLAFSDVQYLFEGLEQALRGAGTTGLEQYSSRALRRAWQAVRFSWWMTTLMHRFPDTGDFERRIQEAELDLLALCGPARQTFAANYTGLAL